MAFKKGQSGNPGGRSKERLFADALRMELAAAGEDHKALRQIAKALIAKARDGDLMAIKEVADRTDGKVPQGMQHSGDEDGFPIIHVIESRIVDPKHSNSGGESEDVAKSVKGGVR